MVTSTLGSAQDFVHTLKAHLDPPLANGSSKIELAREAWETTSFYFPNKDEVIVDWLLTRLLKDKAKAGDASPILDSRYWQLLSDIVCPPDETNVKRTNTSRTAKRWLLPLLNRIPVAPIVTAYFSLSGPLDEHARVTLDKFFSRCLVTIWPLATPKFSPDVLLECFGALLVHLTTRRAGEDDPTNATAHVGKAALLVISSYRTAYGNLANKKKLYTTFLQHHFLHWLQCIQYGVPHDAARLTPISDVYLAGIETLFSVDVLRNVEDHKCDAALKDAISQSSHLSSKAVLHALPLLLTSFVQSLKKNRNALFSQGSSNAAGHASMQVQPAGLAFYALCENILDAAPTPDSTQIWDTRVALLETVDSESLYNPSDANGTEVLRNSGAMAVRVVTYIQEDVAFLDKAEDVLAILTRIDYDLMAPELPVLWPALARTSSNSSSSAYLRLLFEFRTKTRTVNTLVDSWLDAVSLRHWQTCEVQPREAYARVLGSPLFSFESIDRLGQAVHGFLTPSQIVDVTRIIVEKFTGAFQRFREQDKRVAADDGDGSRKKRKKSTSDNVRIDPEWCAVEFALVCRIVVVVLSSLAMRTALEDSRQEIHGMIGAACTSVIPRASKGAQKALEADNRRGTWAWQIVAAGALLVYHDRKSHGWPSVQLDEEVVSQLRGLLDRDDVLPEFRLTIVRTLLNDAAISDDHAAQDIIDAVLRCLEGLQNHDGVAELRWSGKSHELGNDASQAVVAILHLTLIRWLPLFDSRASAEQMIKLAKVILTISRTSSSSSTSNQQLTPSTVLAVTFHNADVWELRRFRDAFLSQLQDCTVALASINVHDFLSGKRRSVPRKLRADISASIAGFEILLYMPEEYLSRALRSDFLHRALVADILIGAGAITDSSVDARALLKAREFIRRAVSHTGSVDQLAVDGYFGYLLKSDALPPVDEQHDLVSVTLDLIGACLVAFVRNSRNGEDTLALAAVQNISGILDVPVEQRTRPSSLITNGTLLRLISVVASNHELSQLSQQLQKSLRELYERLVAVCSTELLRMFPRGEQSEPHANFRNSRLDALRMWSHALWLGRWLTADMSSLPRFGSILLGQLVADRQQSRSTATYLSLLDVLKEELYSSATENRHAYIGYLVADYLVCSRCCDSASVQDLDASFSGISKSMPIEDYSALVGYIVEASAKPTSFSASDIAPMVRLLKIVGLNAPEGTSKITQQAISKTLLLCADRPNYLSVPEIRREVLGLLSGYCSERPASVRSSDMSNVWSILGQLLANSSEHDQTTDPTIFQEAVSIVSALVRLRRDLILNTLPHLGMILRRLISALRGLRPQLGAKQTRLVMNTLPAWISTEKPLSAEEAKALARLITTLTTKTTVRTHGQNAESQKPESLVRPFSKHAAYVLTAYIEAVNDPLCVISTQVRKELQPGLFALCDMLGDYNRDAMMVSALDASGKVTMKALWKEYEKQRYVGRG
ncbi:Urb2/Npa2 family-domain-containing protein [Rhodofomes roseus]|uniref:Urb2/Npa2 family-domain-containing protein n=1 Tax=Rhodofomes roseus TaxID=34475 RepID=A0ABQ8KDN8_9APHY|nr:Urb2/Npa2 family-domain-containing protein [Rhodofomes roseus]KAH9835766.1 Urb2/Npa2 family-domain-containing protein [Rhodofomes roseus]